VEDIGVYMANRCAAQEVGDLLIGMDRLVVMAGPELGE
jgi:hypothetical protein